MYLTGVMAGPIAGLKYQTPSGIGLTNERGEFRYLAGERVAFLVGNSPIGYAVGVPRLTLAHIVTRVDGQIHKLMDAGLTNVARFLCSLDRDGNLDNGIQIAPEDIRDYYEKKFLPAWRSRSPEPPPSPEAAASAGEEILLQERIDNQLDRWISLTRTQVSIRYREEVFANQ